VTLPTDGAAPARRLAWPDVRRDVPAFVPAALIVGLWLVWVGASGGYAPETWYPSACVVFSLWVAVVTIGGRVLPDGRAARIALLAFAALVALNYLSILWAAAQGSPQGAAKQHAR
jgi:hypothetical protein